MKKILKRTLATCFIVIIALIAGLVFFISTLNPNQYKPQIVKAIYEASGYEAKIKGDITLGFYPSLTLAVGQVTLSNRGVLLADIPYAFVKLALAPLLQKKVLIKRIQLEKPELFFGVDDDNNSNWSVITKGGRPKNTSSSGQTTPKDIAPLNDFTLNDFSIQDARITYKQTGQTLALYPLTFQASNVNINQPIQYSLASNLSVKELNKHINTKFTLNGQLRLSLAKLKNNQWAESISTQATLAVEKMAYNNVHFENMLSQITYKNGLATFKINKLSAYKGNVKGALSFHQRKQRFASKLTMENVDVGDLIYDSNGINIIEGTFSSHLNVTSFGQTSRSHIENLEGKMTLNIEKGALKAIDIDALTQSVTDIFSKKRSVDQYLLMSLKQWNQQENFNRKPTPFELLTANVTIKHGVAQTDSLQIHTKTLELQGQGSVSLYPQTLNVNLNISMIKPTGFLKNTLLILDNRIPFTIKGPLRHPITRPDMGLILKSVKEKVLKRHEKDISNTVNQLKDKFNDLKKIF